MTINWKQGLFAAAILLSVSLMIVGCSKSKTDKAVADKSTGEIIGEEIDVIEVVPAQTPNAKTNGAGEQKAPTTPVQPSNDAPAMTPPTTTPTENAPAPTPTQTPDSATAPDSAPSSTTSSVTVSTTCSETMYAETESEPDLAEVMEPDAVIESETTCCHIRRAFCSLSCAPCTEACQPACQAAPACAPDPVCAPEPTCAPAPACAPVCELQCASCRPQPRFVCRPCRTCCRTECRCLRTCSACSAACEPACAPACDSACSSANTMRSDSWSNEQVAPNDSIRNSTLPEYGHSYNKTPELTDAKTNVPAQKVKPSTAVGSDSTNPEAPSIVLPEAK